MLQSFCSLLMGGGEHFRDRYLIVDRSRVFIQMSGFHRRLWCFGFLGYREGITWYPGFQGVVTTYDNFHLNISLRGDHVTPWYCNRVWGKDLTGYPLYSRKPRMYVCWEVQMRRPVAASQQTGRQQDGVLNLPAHGFIADSDTYYSDNGLSPRLLSVRTSIGMFEADARLCVCA